MGAPSKGMREGSSVRECRELWRGEEGCRVHSFPRVMEEEGALLAWLQVRRVQGGSWGTQGGPLGDHLETTWRPP